MFGNTYCKIVLNIVYAFLVNSKKKTCYYFDFGRDHTPFQHGRVRSALTDCELKMETKPIVLNNGKTVANFTEILTELQNNSACHGEGEIHASYTPINFNKAMAKANEMQQKSPLPYGPFKYKGSNCSRFVNEVILSGKPSLKQQFKLKYFVPLTPTPLNNVKSLKYRLALPKLLKTEPFYPFVKLSKSLQKGTLRQPSRSVYIPKNAQWLSGEGAGSWFGFSFEEQFIKVTRYSPNGQIECSGLYKNSLLQKPTDISKFKIQYLSNCQIVTFKNGDKTLTFEKIDVVNEQQLAINKTYKQEIIILAQKHIDKATG